MNDRGDSFERLLSDPPEALRIVDKVEDPVQWFVANDSRRQDTSKKIVKEMSSPHCFTERSTYAPNPTLRLVQSPVLKSEITQSKIKDVDHAYPQGNIKTMLGDSGLDLTMEFLWDPVIAPYRDEMEVAFNSSTERHASQSSESSFSISGSDFNSFTTNDSYDALQEASPLTSYSHSSTATSLSRSSGDLDFSQDDEWQKLALEDWWFDDISSGRVQQNFDGLGYLQPPYAMKSGSFDGTWSPIPRNDFGCEPPAPIDALLNLQEVQNGDVLYRSQSSEVPYSAAEVVEWRMKEISGETAPEMATWVSQSWISVPQRGENLGKCQDTLHYQSSPVTSIEPENPFLTYATTIGNKVDIHLDRGLPSRSFRADPSLLHCPLDLRRSVTRSAPLPMKKSGSRRGGRAKRASLSWSMSHKSQKALAKQDIGSVAMQTGKKDEFLVRSKLAGMSYKDIRAKGRFAEKESTLRGRFRSLTKSKDRRVRKPVWTERDLQLLLRAVNVVTKHITDGGADRPDRCAETGGFSKSFKIPWKQVAEYIVDHGGSYLFGNATCRKKFDEIHGEKGQGP